MCVIVGGPRVSSKLWLFSSLRVQDMVTSHLFSIMLHAVCQLIVQWMCLCSGGIGFSNLPFVTDCQCPQVALQKEEGAQNTPLPKITIKNIDSFSLIQSCICTASSSHKYILTQRNTLHQLVLSYMYLFVLF